MLALLAAASAGVVVIAFWAGWGSEGRPVLPAVHESRPVERA